MSAAQTAVGRARRVAGEFIGWFFETAGGAPPGLVTGAGTAVDERPVVVVLLLAADEDAVATTAQDLAAALADGGPRAVLVLDRPHFAVARRAGVAADHVLSQEDWTARGYAQSWDAYLAEQLDRLRHDFSTRHVVRLPSGGTRAMDPDRLRRELTPPGRGARGAIRWWRRAVVRLERRIDRPS